ncbi:hypothetical protein OROGR_015000 [Orobanche gracilis]
MSGKTTKVDVDPDTQIDVRCQKPKMALLKEKIHSELGIQCYDPANQETICTPSNRYVKTEASGTSIRNCLNPNFEFQKKCSSVDECDSTLTEKDLIPELQVKNCLNPISEMQFSGRM